MSMMLDQVALSPNLRRNENNHWIQLSAAGLMNESYGVMTNSFRGQDIADALVSGQAKGQPMVVLG